jgi:hypothetical protein
VSARRVRPQRVLPRALAAGSPPLVALPGQYEGHPVAVDGLGERSRGVEDGDGGVQLQTACPSSPPEATSAMRSASSPTIDALMATFLDRSKPVSPTGG